MQRVEEILILSHEMGIREQVIEKMKQLNDFPFITQDERAELAYKIVITDIEQKKFTAKKKSS